MLRARLFLSGADGTDVTRCDPLPPELFTPSGAGWPERPSTGPAVQAQVTVIYADESGADTFASPTEGGALDFAEFGGSRVTVERSGYVPEGRPIRSVLIRVFGDQGAVSTGEPGTLLVDVVQPVS